MPARFRTLTSLLTLLALVLSIGQSARAATCSHVVQEVSAAAHDHDGHTAPQPGSTPDTPDDSCPVGHDSMAACSVSVSLPAAVVLTPAATEVTAESALAPNDYTLYLLSVDLFHPPRG